MSTSEKLELVSNYKKGDLDVAGERVLKVISRSNDSLVYLVEGNQLRYEFKNLKFDMTEVMSKFDELRSKVSDELPENIKVKSLASIGIALFHSSRASTPENALASLNQIENRIKLLKTPNEAKAILVAFNFLCCLSLSAILYLIWSFQTNIQQNFLACVSAGGFGSLFSLLQRNASIPLNLTSSISYTFLQSIFICILGAISGAAIYLMCMSGLAFTIAKDNLAMLSLLALISGFSERMIPDLFNKIQKSANEN